MTGVKEPSCAMKEPCVRGGASSWFAWNSQTASQRLVSKAATRGTKLKTPSISVGVPTGVPAPETRTNCVRRIWRVFWMMLTTTNWPLRPAASGESPVISSVGVPANVPAAGTVAPKVLRTPSASASHTTR
jgi:hypothetical protein